MHYLPHPLAAVLDPKARRDEVPDPRGGPHAHVVARLPRAAADRLFDRRPLRRRESRWAPRDRRVLQAWQPGVVQGLHPGTNRLLLSKEPWGDLGTALASHQQEDGVLALPQPDLVSAATGGPDLLSRHCQVRDPQHAQALLPELVALLEQQGLQTRQYFLGSL